MKNTKMLCFKIILVTLFFLMISSIFAFFGICINKTRGDALAVSESGVFKTVVIDAGHGGRDAGASSAGVLEKDLNLSVSKEIQKFLSFFKVNTVMTREDDKLLSSENAKNHKREDLKNRLEIARLFYEPIFVSIHMNKFSDSKYGGLQVFYSRNSPSSKTLADIIQENTKKTLDSANDRLAKRADGTIYLLDRMSSPSVVVECGFLSNDVDLKKLTDEGYRKTLAFVISNSILQFIGC